MTNESRKEAIKHIESQLEDGYIDFGSHDENELEIVKEAIDALKIIDAWNDIPLMTEAWMNVGYTREAAEEIAKSSNVYI